MHSDQFRNYLMLDRCSAHTQPMMSWAHVPHTHLAMASTHTHIPLLNENTFISFTQYYLFRMSVRNARSHRHTTVPHTCASNTFVIGLASHEMKFSGKMKNNSIKNTLFFSRIVSFARSLAMRSYPKIKFMILFLLIIFCVGKLATAVDMLTRKKKKWRDE